MVRQPALLTLYRPYHPLFVRITGSAEFAAAGNVSRRRQPDVMARRRQP